MANKLVPSEAHENFMLDKKTQDDPSIGQANERAILCAFCETCILQECQATKIQMDVDQMQNSMREYDRISTYWHVDSLARFENVWIHRIEGDVKYLCCISCQSAILGYQIISSPQMIFIACDRVKEAL